MSLKSFSITSAQNASAPSKLNIPVQFTDLSLFNNTYAHMKEQFNEEMNRMNEQMFMFSSDLTKCYDESSQASRESSLPQQETQSLRDLFRKSPLVTGEGKNKSMQLQFDVSQFDPTEIKVKLIDDMLIVTANHEEKSKDTVAYREYTRQFKLPPGTDPQQVVSTLYRDGVLKVQVPLPRSLINSIMGPEE